MSRIDEQVQKIREQFRQDLAFSKFDLDEAAENQPLVFDEWNQRWISENAQLDVLQRGLIEEKAKLDVHIRRHIAINNTVELEKLEIYKTTEGALTAAIDNNPKISRTVKKIAEQRYLVNVLKGAVESFQQRRSMLKGLIELEIAGYMGDSSDARKRRILQQATHTASSPGSIPRSPRRRRDES